MPAPIPDRPERHAPDTVRFVLPAYDEERSVGDLLGRIDAVMREAMQAYCVVVVDDGSTDATAAIVREAAERLPVTLVVNERNLGLGGALERGLREAVAGAGPGDAIVTMDADLTQDPCYVPSMIEAYRGGADVVIASRYRIGSRVSGVSAFRRMMSSGARAVLAALMPVPGVRDYSCGFRLYAAPVLAQAFADFGDRFITERGFACMAEILLKLRLRASFAEVGFQLHYEEKRKASAMKVGRTVASYFRAIAEAWWLELTVPARGGGEPEGLLALRLAWLGLVAALVFVLASAWLTGPLMLVPAVLAGGFAAAVAPTRREATWAGGIGGLLGGALTLWYVDAAATTARIAHLPKVAIADAPSSFFDTFVQPLMQYQPANLYFHDPLGMLAYVLLGAVATAVAAQLAARLARGWGEAGGRRLLTWALCGLLVAAFLATAWTQTGPLRTRIGTQPARGTYFYDAYIFLSTYYEMGKGGDYYQALVRGASGDKRLIAEGDVKGGKFVGWVTSPGLVRQPWVFWLWRSVSRTAIGVYMLALGLTAVLLVGLLWAFEPYLGQRALLVPLLGFPLLMSLVVWVNVFFPDYWAALALLGSMLVLLRRRFVLAGALALAAALFREPAALWLAVLLASAVVFRLRGAREWGGRALAFAGMLAAFAVAYALHLHAAAAIVGTPAHAVSIAEILRVSASRPLAARFVAPASYVMYAYGFYQLPAWLFLFAQLPGLALVLRSEPHVRILALAFAGLWLAFTLTIGGTSSYWGQLYMPMALAGTAALLALPLPAVASVPQPEEA